MASQLLLKHGILFKDNKNMEVISTKNPLKKWALLSFISIQKTKQKMRNQFVFKSILKQNEAQNAPFKYILFYFHIN